MESSTDPEHMTDRVGEVKICGGSGNLNEKIQEILCIVGEMIVMKWK